MARINTYPENTSIEDNDNLLTYDTSASATKITPFSRVWTWIQSKLNALTKQTAIASTDQLLMVKGGNTTGRIDYNVLAKAIIEQYNGSTLGGSAQTLQAAINALNSKASWTNIPTGSDLNNITDLGTYCTASTSQTSSIINKPSDLTSAFSMIIARRGASINQIIFDYGGAIYIRGQLSSGWHNWYKFTGTTIS